MTDAASGYPLNCLPTCAFPQRPYIRGTPLTARIDECSITPLEAPGAPKLIFVRGALRGHEEGSVPFRLHIQQITMEFHEELWHIFTFTSSSSHKFAIDLDATSFTDSAGFTDIRHLQGSTSAADAVAKRYRPWPKGLRPGPGRESTAVYR